MGKFQLPHTSDTSQQIEDHKCVLLLSRISGPTREDYRRVCLYMDSRRDSKGGHTPKPYKPYKNPKPYNLLILTFWALRLPQLSTSLPGRDPRRILVLSEQEAALKASSARLLGESFKLQAKLLNCWS